MSISHDKRNAMATQLMLQGYATADQLLEASYGEWPPKGLDIVGTNNQVVNIMPLWKMNSERQQRNGSNTTNPLNTVGGLLSNIWDALGTAGRATLGGERVIGINQSVPFLPALGTLRSTLGHELIHILQGDHYYRADSIFGRAHSWRLIRPQQNDTHSNIIAEKIFNNAELRDKPHLLRRVFNLVSGGAEYHKEGLEIQARLHEVLTEGYQRWGVLPANKREFLVAMQNAGFKFPERITEALENLPEIEELRTKFSGQNRSLSEREAASGIKIAESLLNEAGKNEFWLHMMPDIYTDLIEMYGDKEGGKRFGYTRNVIGELRDTEDFAEMQAIHAHNHSVRGMSS